MHNFFKIYRFASAGFTLLKTFFLNNLFDENLKKCVNRRKHIEVLCTSVYIYSGMIINARSELLGQTCMFIIQVLSCMGQKCIFVHAFCMSRMYIYIHVELYRSGIYSYVELLSVC